MKIPFNQYNKSHNSLGYFIFFSKTEFGHVPFSTCRNDRAPALWIIINLEHKIRYRLLKWCVAKFGSNLYNAKLATAEGICVSLASLQVSSKTALQVIGFQLCKSTACETEVQPLLWSRFLWRSPANRHSENLQCPWHQWESLPLLQQVTQPLGKPISLFCSFFHGISILCHVLVDVCRCMIVYIHTTWNRNKTTVFMLVTQQRTWTSPSEMKTVAKCWTSNLGYLGLPSGPHIWLSDFQRQ